MWATLQAAGTALARFGAASPTLKWTVIGFAALLLLVPVTDSCLRVYEKLMTVNSNIETTLIKNCADRGSALARMQSGGTVIDRQSGPVTREQPLELNPEYNQLIAECDRFLKYKSTGDVAQSAKSGWLDTAGPLVSVVVLPIVGLVIVALALVVVATAFEVIARVIGRAATKAGRRTAEVMARATWFIASSLMVAALVTFLLHIGNLSVVSHEAHDWFYFNVAQPMALYGFPLSVALFAAYKGLSNAIEQAKAS
jgi:hypothetical protein